MTYIYICIYMHACMHNLASWRGFRAEGFRALGLWAFPYHGLQDQLIPKLYAQDPGRLKPPSYSPKP